MKYFHRLGPLAPVGLVVAMSVCCMYGAAIQKLSYVINYLLSDTFPPMALQHRHAQSVRDSSSKYKIDYVVQVKNILNPKKHQNCIIGSKVMAIWLNG